MLTLHLTGAGTPRKDAPKTLAGVSNQHVEQALDRKNKRRKFNESMGLPAVSFATVL